MQRNEIRLIGGLLIAAALALATVSATAAQTQPVPGSRGMMGGNGPGLGTGMMGGYGQGTEPSTSLDSLDAARQAFAGYVDRTGNQDLVLDEVMQFQWNYYAIVKERSSSNGAFELLADPRTGLVFPEMGPNMIWNTRYRLMATYGGGMMGGFAPGGMMSGTWGPTAPTAEPTVTADLAKQIAQQWLDQYQVGSATEAPDIFPGYYTLHITTDGRISGMLSVNAYTRHVSVPPQECRPARF